MKSLSFTTNMVLQRRITKSEETSLLKLKEKLIFCGQMLKSRYLVRLQLDCIYQCQTLILWSESQVSKRIKWKWYVNFRNDCQDSLGHDHVKTLWQRFQLLNLRILSLIFSWIFHLTNAMVLLQYHSFNNTFSYILKWSFWFCSLKHFWNHEVWMKLITEVFHLI